MKAIADSTDGVVIDLLVQPRASRDKLGPAHGDRIKLAVTSPPVDGEANARVIEVLAKLFGVAKRDVEIRAGRSSRRKTVYLRGVSAEAVRTHLA